MALSPKVLTAGEEHQALIRIQYIDRDKIGPLAREIRTTVDWTDKNVFMAQVLKVATELWEAVESRIER
jgi:hypothetical protein